MLGSPMKAVKLPSMISAETSNWVQGVAGSNPAVPIYIDERATRTYGGR